MNGRYIIKPCDTDESFKIVDTGTLLGSEDKDYEWVASVYDFKAARHICDLLNKSPHTKSNRTLEP